MTGDAKSGYNINVRETRKLEVTEVVTSTCGPTDTYKSEEIWFNSVGTGVDATVDPKQPGRLIGTHDVALGGGLDQQYRWNLRRGK